MALLSKFDFADYRRMLPRAASGTCKWVLSHPEFQSWTAEDKTSLLWVFGSPGCGKTTLSSWVVKRLGENNADSTALPLVCSYFCDDKVALQRDTQTILKSVIYQLVCHCPPLIRHVTRAFQLKGAAFADSFSALWNIFRDCLSDTPSGVVYIIIDALDECADVKLRAHFLEAIGEMIQVARSTEAPAGCIKFFMTSRPELAEASSLIQSEYRRLFIDTQEGVQQDVHLVVRDRVSRLSQQRGWSPDLKDHLEQTLLSKADDTFLWVHMILESLEDSLTTAKGDLLTRIDELPRGLEATYRKFLAAVPRGYEAIAWRLLLLILGASRHLTLDEVNLAFTVSPNHRMTQDVLSDCQTSMSRLLQGVLGPFVRVNDSRVSLVHQSAKEFLLTLAAAPDNPLSEAHGIRETTASLAIASASMQYLLLGDFTDDVVPVEDLRAKQQSCWTRPGRHSSLLENIHLHSLKSQEMESHYGFFRYAALNWAQQFASAQGAATPELQRAATTLLDPRNTNAANWMTFFWLNSPPIERYFSLNLESYQSPDWDSLSWAAFFDIRHALVEFLGPASQFSKDSALIRASQMGHELSVKMLLAAGADPNQRAEDVEFNSALTIAALEGHTQVVVVLLSDCRTDVTFRAGMPRHPAIFHASVAGHEDIVEVLSAQRDD